MPNKIVQLIDSEDNNIYPVAGSLKQGSVTSSTINDGAVTTPKIADEAVEVDKIDFATMKGYANSLPIATKANTIATLGNTNLTGTLTRYGDLVFLYINATIGATHTTYDQQDFGYIAGGYRPAIDTIAAGNMTSGSSQTGCFSLKIGTDGNILGSCPPTTDTTRVQVFGCWITNDTWPS